MKINVTKIKCQMKKKMVQDILINYIEDLKNKPFLWKNKFLIDSLKNKKFIRIWSNQ